LREVKILIAFGVDVRNAAFVARNRHALLQTFDLYGWRRLGLPSRGSEERNENEQEDYESSHGCGY